MKIKLAYYFLVFFILVNHFYGFSVENSIIPLMEKYETIENLASEKYSKKQLSEIQDYLKQKDNRIRLVTYNMLFNLYDHKLEEQHRWPNRMPRLVEMIKEMQADVIGVQELYHDQVKELLPFMTDEYEFFAKACEDGELNGIFYRKDRFEVIASKVTYMTLTPETPSSETLTMLHLRDKKTGQEFAIFNTHLAFSNIEKREFQARFVADHLEPYIKHMPVIFTGDLNTFPNRPELNRLPFYDGDYIHRILTKNSLRDAKEMSLLGHLGPIATFTNSSNDVLPFQGIGTPGIFLDHIYVSQGLTVLLHAVQPGTVGGEFPSDHMPVIMDFLLGND